MTMVLHLTTEDAWDSAQRTGELRAASLDVDGFIHFSTPEQIVTLA
jgi:uncharacterized protein (DUF952 family)